MKTLRKLIVLITFVLLSTVVFAQNSGLTIPPEKMLKARKEAEKEAKQMTKKEWRVRAPENPIDSQLLKAYIAKYMVDKNGVNGYAAAFGNSLAPTIEQCEIDAIKKCKLNHLGIMMLYFNSWNAVNKEINDNDRKKITEALKLAEDDIKTSYMAFTELPVLSVYRPVGKNYESHVRIVYNQQKSKEIARQIITKILVSKYSFNEEKAQKMLTYKK